MNAEQAWQKYLKLWKEYLKLSAKSAADFEVYQKSSQATHEKLDEVNRAFKEYGRLTGK